MRNGALWNSKFSFSKHNGENDSTAQSRETGANITELKEDYVAQHICPLCGSEDVEDGHFLCSECEEKMELDGEE